MLNLFVAVILENFEYEMEAESDSRKVKRADLDAFAHAWSIVHQDVIETEERILARIGGPSTRLLALKQRVRARHQHRTKKADRHWLPARRVRDVLMRLEPPLGIQPAKRYTLVGTVYDLLFCLRCESRQEFTKFRLQATADPGGSNKHVWACQLHPMSSCTRAARLW